MSNFAFIRTSLPVVHADCVRAESYLSSDPAAACFYSRRAIEQLVGHLYDVIGLSEPYQNDLSARINDAAFKSTVGVGITAKLNLIRKVGNAAAHEGKPIQQHTALQVLRELFHVVVFTAYRYSTDPQAVPTGAQFDPALGATLAPVPPGAGEARRKVQGPGRGSFPGARRARRPGRGQGRRDCDAKGSDCGGSSGHHQTGRPRLLRGRDPSSHHRRPPRRGRLALGPGP